jgi:hypothetical protein
VHAGKVSVDLAAKVVKTEPKEAQKAFAAKVVENPKQQPKRAVIAAEDSQAARARTSPPVWIRVKRAQNEPSRTLFSVLAYGKLSISPMT